MGSQVNRNKILSRHWRLDTRQIQLNFKQNKTANTTQDSQELPGSKNLRTIYNRVEKLVPRLTCPDAIVSATDSETILPYSYLNRAK